MASEEQDGWIGRVLGLSVAGQAGGAPGVVSFAKSRLAWLAARQKLESDIDKLRAEIVAIYQDDDDVEDLEDLYLDHVEPLLTALDESLGDKLDEATNAADPAERGRLVAEAKAMIASYQNVVATNPLIGDLDANPFVQLSIAQTMTTTLAALAASVH